MLNRLLYALYATPHTIIEIPCNTKQVYLVNTDNNTLLIDPGALGTFANSGIMDRIYPYACSY